MRYFDRLHPIVAFLYFVFVILIAMLSMNPVIITICYLSGVAFCGMLIGLKKILISLAYNIPLLILLALTNPMFVHKGETILFFLNDNPVTKEAILYGLFASMMIMSVFYWFRCYSEIMTSDKFVYLFGRVIPKLSLVLSMSLAFIPKLKRKYKEIDEAQKALGIYSTQSYVDKIRSKFRVLSILLTNSLENSIETADSMRARGYGLKGRSSYAIYRFTVSDGIFMGFSLLLGITATVLIILGFANFNFYPILSPFNVSGIILITYVTIVILAGVSIVMEVKENMLWRYLKSKI
ncbi:MAG: energy-coupling factor transporter transmembrane protein EcfT [Clostridia bacterium]|nr:energy-coupling factor transporter transmembrane protein EcfT [Clostridia bacterium]